MRAESKVMTNTEKVNAIKKLLQEYELWDDAYYLPPAHTGHMAYFLSHVPYNKAILIHRLIMRHCSSLGVTSSHTSLMWREKDGGTLTLLSVAIDQVARIAEELIANHKAQKASENASFSAELQKKDKKHQAPKELFVPVLPFERDEIHFDPVHADKNGVYVFALIMKGDPIGEDNTCKSLLAIRGCFGVQKAPGVESAQDAINRYIKKLQTELAMYNCLPRESRSKYESFINQKQNRLNQLFRYQDLLNQIGNRHGVKISSENRFPTPIQELFGKKQNCVSISLSPAKEDSQIGVDPKHALFSVTRKRPEEKTTCSTSGLGYELRTMLADEKTKLMERPGGGVRGLIIREAVKKCGKKAVNNNADLTALKKNINEAYLNFLKTVPDEKVAEFDLETLLENQETGKKIKPSALADWKYFTETVRNVDQNDPVSTWAYYLFRATVPDVIFSPLDIHVKSSPFDEKEDVQEGEVDKFSRRCQKFLATVSAFCCEKDLSSADFGQVIETDDQLCKKLLEQIQKAINKNQSVEDAILAVVNESRTSNNPFKLTRELSNADKDSIKERFRIFYKVSLESPHDDEYILFLGEKEGPFYNVNGTMALPLEEFMRVSEGEQKELKSLREQFFDQSGSNPVPPLPKVPDYKQHRTVKTGLSPKDLIFQVNLTALLDATKDPSDFITMILTAQVPGTSRRLVSDSKLITREHQLQIVNSPWWEEIRKKVLLELRGAFDIDNFLLWPEPFEKPPAGMTVLIPHDMEEWLYSYTRERTRNEQALMGYSGAEKVKRAFKCLNEIKESKQEQEKESKDKKPAIHLHPQEIIPSGSGGYLVTFPKEEKETWKTLEKEFETTLLRIHIPRLMAKSLYCHLISLGQTVPSLPERPKIADYEIKMKTTLESVGCSPNPVVTTLGWNGYAATVNRMEDLDTINEIYQSYLRSDQVCAIQLSLEECRKLCGDSKLSISQAYQKLMHKISAKQLDILVGSMEIVNPSDSKKDSKNSDSVEPYIQLVVENDIKSSQRKQGLAAIALMLTEPDFDFNQKERTVKWEQLTSSQNEQVRFFYDQHAVENPFLAFTPVKASSTTDVYVGPPGCISVGSNPPSPRQPPQLEEKTEKEGKKTDQSEKKVEEDNPKAEEDNPKAIDEPLSSSPIVSSILPTHSANSFAISSSLGESEFSPPIRTKTRWEDEAEEDEKARREAEEDAKAREENERTRREAEEDERTRRELGEKLALMSEIKDTQTAGLLPIDHTLSDQTDNQTQPLTQHTDTGTTQTTDPQRDVPRWEDKSSPWLFFFLPTIGMWGGACFSLWQETPSPLMFDEMILLGAVGGLIAWGVFQSRRYHQDPAYPGHHFFTSPITSLLLTAVTLALIADLSIESLELVKVCQLPAFMDTPLYHGIFLGSAAMMGAILWKIYHTVFAAPATLNETHAFASPLILFVMSVGCAIAADALVSSFSPKALLLALGLGEHMAAMTLGACLGACIWMLGQWRFTQGTEKFATRTLFFAPKEDPTRRNEVRADNGVTSHLPGQATSNG